MSGQWKCRFHVAGGATHWVLATIVVLGILFFVFTRPKAPPPSPPIAEPTPAPATPPPATPAPVVVKPTPTPTPVVLATPAPTPPPPLLALATIAQSPTLWPPQVVLVRAVPFPVTVNGRRVGEVTAPVGTRLRVLRVTQQHVEVEYQKAKHLIAVASTDLVERALVTFRAAGSRVPEAPLPPVALAPQGLSAALPGVRPTTTNPGRIGERIAVDVVRQKRTRIEGGDFDDKRDRISLKVKLTNSDPSAAANALKGEIYTFAESILDRTAVKLLATDTFEFSLPPRGSHEMTTGEVSTQFDTTGARFGYRYEGWLLRVRDSAGVVVLVKSSSPTMAKNAEKVSAIGSGKTFDRTSFKEKSVAR